MMSAKADVAGPGRHRFWIQCVRYGVIFLQILAAGLVVYLYDIEGRAFSGLFALIACGFFVNLFLPVGYRLPFFVLLSLAGAFIVFTPVDALWLIGCGMLLIALCHIPVAFAWRVVFLVVVAATLAVSRSGAVSAPWSDAVWPILGSMFMFRLVLYARVVKLGEARSGWWGALAYFFMVPNLVFPLFPVVDYHAFERNRYDRNDLEIYQRGVLWITRGLLHLLLYRLVYHAVLNDPADVEGLGDLVQFMLGTILLYLRVSGTFHLIVGILHLFGFRLPETHRLYYLAHDFTELWRRINIYWKDFMTKVVFYPVYFRVKSMGPTKSLVIATVAVFFSTWLLHSYQWFWLRGGFPVTLPDILFWGILGMLVVRGVLSDAKPGAVRQSGTGRWDFRRGLRVAGTFGAFCTLWSLWSTESVVAWLWLISAAGKVDVKGVALLVAVFTVLFVLGSRRVRLPDSQPHTWHGLSVNSAARTSAWLLALLAASNPTVLSALPPWTADGLSAFKMTGLNQQDAALHHRGYYEQLDVRSSLHARVRDLAASRPDDWQDLSEMNLFVERDDLVLRELQASRSVIWNGNHFSTNRWGMRDREYPKKKPNNVIRIALLGPSHVMGNGVSDDETFESLVEARLNEERPLGPELRFEVLNLGVDGFSIAQQVAWFEHLGMQFDPDVAIITSHRRDQVVMEQYLLKLIGRNIAVPHDELRGMLENAGLQYTETGAVPVPFGWLRQIVSGLGLNTRMPQSEAEFKVRRIAGPTLDFWIERFADLSSEHGVVPLALGLNAVIDNPSAALFRQDVYERAGIPVMDLLNIFPEQKRQILRVGAWDDHPNAAGHRVIADELYPVLISHLQGVR